MAEIQETLSQKAGPLPVWVWGVGIGVVAVAYIWWSGREQGIVAPDETTAAAAGSSGDRGVYDAIDGAFQPSAPAGSVSIPSLESPGEIDNNNAWSFRAVAYLVGQGIAPVTAQIAINNYIEEKQLTDAQSKLVNQAITGIGAPPVRVSIETPSVTTPAAVTLKSWQRLASGQIVAVMSDGTRQNRSIRQYIDAGMPAFKSNAYEVQTYKVRHNATTYADVARKYRTSVDNLMVLNKVKSIPNLKKGSVVVVPARKGTGKS